MEARAGREPAASGELVIDRTTADQHQIAIGDRITLLDSEATVVGLSDETTFWAGSVAFARISTLEALRRSPGGQELPAGDPDHGQRYGGSRSTPRSAGDRGAPPSATWSRTTRRCWPAEVFRG